VLLIVTVAEDVTRSTANLLAPVVVNARTLAAEQVVLTGQDFPLRAPLIAA
jgi:flagellar assembly factor FliW